jgi:hypothetical protein
MEARGISGDTTRLFPRSYPTYNAAVRLIDVRWAGWTGEEEDGVVADAGLSEALLALAVPTVLTLLRELMHRRTKLALERQRQSILLQLIRCLPSGSVIVQTEAGQYEVHVGGVR